MLNNSFNTGDWIGAYQVESRLRSGGMATLFLARRSGAAGFSRRAAIKVIHPHLSQDERFVRMFVDEARISSKISHPNVVHVEEFGEEGGLFFLVMEYVDGCSASQLLRLLHKAGETLPVDIAAHIALKVGEGLHSAHETPDDEGNLLGIVHRDVSPSNVLLSREGHIKIIDFGIAKARGRLAGTEAGYALKGKIRYMSPEQARGEPVDRRSDVYACGVVLWELLAADRAFEAENEFALLEKVRDPQLKSIRDVRPDVPEALEDVIRRATSKNRDDRPQDAYEFSRLVAKALPDALMIDQREFARLIDRVPAKTRNRDGATPSREGTDLSWVSDISAGSSQQRLATGSSPQRSQHRAPTSTDVFDPALFVEPTPLPEPMPVAGFGEPEESYESVEIDALERARRESEAAATPSASGGAGWIRDNRVIIGLCGAGALIAIGLIVGSGMSRDSRPAPAAVPANAAGAVTGEPGANTAGAVGPAGAVAPAPVAAETPPAAVERAGDPAANRAADPAGDPAADPAAKTAKADDSPGDSPASRSVVRRRTRPRGKKRTAPRRVDPPLTTPAVTTDRRSVDGVVIADRPGDDKVERPKARRPRDEGPSRAGKTPIAEGFDD